MKYIIYTDGACSGNPGKGGWGVYIENHDTSFQLNGGDINTTKKKQANERAGILSRKPPVIRFLIPK